MANRIAVRIEAVSAVETDDRAGWHCHWLAGVGHWRLIGDHIFVSPDIKLGMIPPLSYSGACEIDIVIRFQDRIKQRAQAQRPGVNAAIDRR